MGYEVYRVRRKFQWNVWVYSPPGVCQCSADFGSEATSTRYNSAGEQESGQFDRNACYNNLTHCKGQVGSGCTCPDGGYCACSIKPFQYGGDIWLVNEGDPRKEHILARRFVVYDPTLDAADEYLKQEKYKVLVMGEPNPDKVYFPPQAESINGVSTPQPVLESEPNTEEPSPVVRQALEAAGISNQGEN